MTKSEAVRYLLREDYTPSWELLESLVVQFNGFRYEFVPPTAFEALIKSDVAAAMEIYWREMLFRAHWAASGSLIRTHRWLSGLFDAFAGENLIVFSACFRGFLESAADTWYSLGPAAPTLASAKSVIVQALNRALTKNTLAEDLENRFIHFAFAHKPVRGESLREQHEAETITKYLSTFETDQPSIRRLYGKLCDVVHPGASSVLSFAKPLDDQAATVVFDVAGEAKALAEFAVAFRILLPTLMASGVNTGLFILRTLNRLPLTSVHTSSLEDVPFQPNSAWAMIEQMLDA